MRQKLSLVILIVSTGLSLPSFASQGCTNLNPRTEADLSAIIRNPECRIKSIDDLLEVLKKTPDPVLIYHSASIQGPTWPPDYLNPRAIIGPYGSGHHVLYLSFNGQPSEAQYRHLEILEINKAKSKPSTDIFRYYDVAFGAETQSDRLSWQETQKSILFSQANPNKCAVCHGDPARPIFQSYPIWRGIYGSFDLTEKPEEKKWFKAFKAQAPDRPRYRNLNLSEYAAGDLEPDPDFLTGRANSNLDTDLGEANAIRVARLTEKTPNYMQYKYAILAAMLNCQRITDYFPNNLNRQMELNISARARLNEIDVTNNLKKILAVGVGQFGSGYYLGDIGDAYQPVLTLQAALNFQSNYWANNTLMRLWLDTEDKQGAQQGTEEAVKLRYVFESRGIDIASWFMDLKQPTYRLMTGIDGGEYLGFALIRDDGDFRTYPQHESGLPEVNFQTICQDLKPRSLQALQGVGVEPLLATSPIVGSSGTAASRVGSAVEPAVFKNTCAKCHDSSAVPAPKIPFLDESQLRAWLNEPGKKQLLVKKITSQEPFQMPPTRQLTDAEQNEIFNYLNRVAP